MTSAVANCFRDGGAKGGKFLASSRRGFASVHSFGESPGFNGIYFWVELKRKPGNAADEGGGASHAGCESGAGKAGCGVYVGTQVSYVKDGFDGLIDGRPMVCLECSAVCCVGCRGVRFGGCNACSQVGEVGVSVVEQAFEAAWESSPEHTRSMSSASTRGIAPCACMNLVHGRAMRAINTMDSGQPWGMEVGLV